MLDNLNRIYSERFSRLLFTENQDVREYTVSTPIETSEIISLHELRNDWYKESKGADNMSFIALIDNLKKFNEQKLLIHILHVDGEPKVVYTDTLQSHVIGEL